jgi:hypothetical protein
MNKICVIVFMLGIGILLYHVSIASLVSVKLNPNNIANQPVQNAYGQLEPGGECFVLYPDEDELGDCILASTMPEAVNATRMKEIKQDVEAACNIMLAKPDGRKHMEYYYCSNLMNSNNTSTN